MANSNAKSLINGIPSCVSGCFQNGVEATGCNQTDYDCYCYSNNHQTIVDTMYTCLDNRERKLGTNCTEDEMFQMENRYWMVCEQYWEPTGTATQPASATETSKTSKQTSYTTLPTTVPVFTLTSTALANSQTPSVGGSTSSKDSETSPSSNLANENGGLSTGVQAGIGIGVAVVAILLFVSVFLWIRERKKRHLLEEKLVEANEANLVRGMGYMNEKGEIYEMEGDRPHCEELRGDMRTPELSGMARSLADKEEIGSIRSVSSSECSDSSSMRSMRSMRSLSPPPPIYNANRDRRVLSQEAQSMGNSLRPPSDGRSHTFRRGSA